MVEKTLSVELTLSEPFLLALGEVISQWAYFESKFDDAIQFMRMDKKAESLETVIPFSFKGRISLFSKSYEVCFSSCPELISRFTDIKEETSRLKTTRDYITHCTWAGNSKDGYLITHVLKKNGYESKRITVNLLRDTSCDISELTRRVMAITNPVFGDYSFPLTTIEESALQNFRDRNFPILPSPDIALLCEIQSR